MAAGLGSDIVFPCDVAADEEIDRLFASLVSSDRDASDTEETNGDGDQ